MWNLLVVEDESIVRVGLRYMLNWAELGIHWKAEASSGEEALKIIESETIHIVMTDIRMPGMSGLELCEQLKERHPDIQIIVLSSYDTFSYVKEAFKLGAVDYLHKPTMDDEEIAATFNKVAAKLKETQGQDALLATEIKEEYLLSLLDKYTFPKEAKLPESANLAAGYWLTIFRQRDDAMTDTDLDNLRFLSLRYLIDEYVAKDWGGIVFHRSFREVIWIAPNLDKSGHSDRTKYLDRLREKVLQLLNVAIIHSSSTAYADIGQLPDAYMEALLRLPVNEQSDNFIVRQAKVFIDTHLLEDITLVQVAESIHVSPGYLSRIFYKEVKENFTEYITRNKIEHAQKLLRGTARKVYEIAAEIGYSNPHYFSKLFKERTGVTPLEYRNQ